LSKHFEQASPELASIDGASAGEAINVPFGDFRLLREIGRGGMGTVYEAEQLSLSGRVAVKVLPFAAILDRRHLARFQNEVRAVAALKHPNIVSVYSVGQERGVHFYAMELVEGQPLSEVIRVARAQSTAETASRRPDADESDSQGLSVDTRPKARLSTDASGRGTSWFHTVADWGIQAAEALQHAHAHGIVRLVEGISPWPDGTFPFSFTNVNGLLYFATGPHRSELWQTDGTEAGTIPVPGLAGAEGRTTIEVGGRLFFFATDGLHGRELWVLNTDVPEVADQAFRLYENSGSGTPLGVIAATDPNDDPLTFTEKTGQRAFAIDASSGAITLADASQINFDTMRSVELEVEVSDGKFSDTAAITIDLVLAGDADLDDEVDFADFVRLANFFGQSEDVDWTEGDFDHSGTVDFADFAILAGGFGRRVR
jgi:ELWxxDGT repeat protein